LLVRDGKIDVHLATTRIRDVPHLVEKNALNSMSMSLSGWQIITGRDRSVRRHICGARTSILEIASVVVDAVSGKRMSPLKHVN
jgi:hypothetical protein